MKHLKIVHVPGNNAIMPILAAIVNLIYCRSICSTMCSAIASDDVAAGDGAFRTNTALSIRSIAKSSSSEPSRFIACARIPRPPHFMSDASISGTNSCAPSTNDRLLAVAICSRAARMFWLANRQNAADVEVCQRSPMLRLHRLYPSRANERKAFGPTVTRPSIIRVRCTPRNG